VVVAAEGYPGTAAAGDEISGLADAERMPGAYVLHAGTRPHADGGLVSAGGRVLDVVGTGADLAAARDAAYGAVARIRMRGGWCRTDIARLPASRTPAET
jgi:phosphoribosylamine--glycine ligase